MEQLVGNTPLLELHNIERELRLKARLLAKLEYFNPAGSVKDRVALNMILEAEKMGVLKEGGTIIEPTSGNTGIGICAVGAARGYSVIIVMPDIMSVERRQLMTAYGAKLVLTDGKLGMRDAIEKAEEISRQMSGSVILGQFTNPDNPDTHRKTTGVEIFSDTDGAIDVFVAGVGTGGTITGVGECIKANKPDVHIVAVEPEGSAVLSGCSAGPHKLQGIGAGFVPSILNTGIYDEIVRVSDADAFASARLLARTEGILVGVSSGAALSAATKVAERDEYSGKLIVVLLPDGGDKYLSMGLYE